MGLFSLQSVPCRKDSSNKCWLYSNANGIPLNACKYLRIEPRASKSSFITGKANIYYNKWLLNYRGISAFVEINYH